MLARLLGVLLLFTVSTQAAHAEDPDIVVVGWFDHFTYGLINTAIGIPVALTGVIANAIRGEKTRVTIDSTGQQIKLNSNVNGFNYSTGAFHHGDCCDAHEAGHAKQSAVLGPAYLPVVGLTYLIQGLDVGVVEDWADAWQDLGSTMENNNVLRTEVEVRDRDGKGTTRVGLNFTIMERGSRVNVGGTSRDNNPTQVVYQYGKIAVYLMVPTGNSPASPTPIGAGDKDAIFPARVEATVLEKDFSAKWTVVGGVFSVLADSNEKTGAVQWDLTDRRVQAQLLSQTLGFGVRVGDEKKIALDVMGRAKASVEGVWFTGFGQVGQAPAGASSPGVMLTAGVGAEARLHILDYVELFAKWSKEWSVVGESYDREIKSFGAQTPVWFRSTTFTDRDRRTGKEKKKLLPVFGGIELRHEVENFGGGPDNGGWKSDVKSMFFTLGGRW